MCVKNLTVFMYTFLSRPLCMSRAPCPNKQQHSLSSLPGYIWRIARPKHVISEMKNQVFIPHSQLAETRDPQMATLCPMESFEGTPEALAWQHSYKATIYTVSPGEPECLCLPAKPVRLHENTHTYAVSLWSLLSLSTVSVSRSLNGKHSGHTVQLCLQKCQDNATSAL